MQTALVNAFGRREPPWDMRNDSFSLFVPSFFLHLFSVHQNTSNFVQFFHLSTLDAPHVGLFCSHPISFFNYFWLSRMLLWTHQKSHTNSLFFHLFSPTTFSRLSCRCHLLLAYYAVLSKRGLLKTRLKVHTHRIRKSAPAPTHIKNILIPHTHPTLDACVRAICALDRSIDPLASGHPTTQNKMLSVEMCILFGNKIPCYSFQATGCTRKEGEWEVNSISTYYQRIPPHW